MKNLYILLGAILASTGTMAQNFFLEDFNTCELPSGWTNTAVTGDTAWVFGDNAAGSPSGNVDGSCMAYVHDDDLTGSYPAVIMDLVSPTLDLSSLDTAVLQFDYVFEDLGDSYFAVALWNGAAWDTVFTENSDPGCFGFYPDCSPRNASINIADYLNADFQMKFIYDDGDGWNWYVGLDNVAIYVPPTDDAVAVGQVSPSDGCGLSSAETVSIIVFNNGQNNITSIGATYEVGAQSETESFTVNIAPNESDTLTFTATTDLAVAGDYDFTAWVDLDNDLNNTNDTITFSVASIPVISGLPYSEDFESGAGGWVSGGVLNSWELGDPETAFIDTANSGVNAWVTNLTGNYNLDEQSYVESPCLDFSSLAIDPVFRFAFISNSEPNWDGTVIEVSTDAGVTWNILGNNGEGTNWYNNATDNWWDAPFGAEDEWFVATHLLDGTAGSGSVKIRVSFSSDDSFNGYDGFAFDDVEIFEQPSINAGVVEILSPVTGCGLTAAETVSIVIENFGDADLVDFNVGYDIGAGAVTEMVTDTLFSATTDTFSFSTTADFSALGNIDLMTWTAVAGDGDLQNDSLSALVFNSAVVSSYPYEEDFESGPANFYSEGENGIWELGNPEGLLIDTAASGINAWATNLDSLYYNVDQVSYLYTPCFDFSALVIDPILGFSYISNSEVGWDGMWVETSTDAGQTWNMLGNFGEGTNWYNNETDNWFDGNSADTVGWVTSEHLLNGMAGESGVKLRFAFFSDPSFADFEGFAIDDFSITEQPAINSEVTTIEGPVTACQLTASEEVTVEITNIGSLPMDSVILGFTFDNGNPFVEVFDSVIQPNGSASFTFSQTVDLSTSGDYDLTVWTGTIGDGDTSNDTLSITVTSVPTISTIPYFEDFESGTGGWNAGGVENSWEFGQPEGAFIDTANSGVNAWVTNLSGPYNVDEVSYLESPCMDFSNVTDDPVLSFAHIYETESCCDEGWVEVSTDGGTTFTKLGLSGEGENWYNDGDNQWWDGTSGDPTLWRTAEHILDGTAGESDVKIRFILNADFSVQGEGFGVDDISVHPQPQLDLVALSMDAPVDGCNLGEATVSMTFWNKGLQSVSGFDLGFRVDGGTAQTETYTGTVDQGDTASYTFSVELADLSTAGAHSIDVFTALTGDEDVTSDTVFNNEVINHGTTTPLSQTEEPVNAIISSTFAEGTSSEMFFCGLPSALDGCLEIESLSIDSLGHTWLSDVDMFLISPAGDTLELSTDNGGSGDNMVNVVFTDTSSNDITLQTAGIAPGYYHTEDTLGFAGLYNGQDPNGAWTLWIDDDLGGDNGQLVSWSMTFTDNSPTPMLDYSDTTICLTHVLAVGLDNTYDSYLWSTGNNTQQIDLFGNVLGLGQHEISVTVDQDGCTGVSNSFVVTVDACAGISELDGLTIDIYPNPTNGSIVLDIEGESNGFVVDIIDVNGKSVHNQSIGNITNGVRKTIDLSHVANGIYFLRLDDGQSFTTRKLIKQ